VNMPVLNGIEAARRYRATMPEDAGVPILALTADATTEAQERCAEAGMSGCITKPVEAARLIELIDQFCADRAIGDEDLPSAAPAYQSNVASAEVAAPEQITGAPIDVDALQALDELGGRAFVQEIVTQFVGDSVGVLRGLSAAVAANDLEAFRDRAHALRSCAANVGAQSVYRLCLSWRELDALEFALHGRDYMRNLEAEFEQARTALHNYLK
jgi:two-component system, sensor histidine kinase RpfC